MWYIHTMEYYSALKGNSDTNTVTWMNPKDMMVSERSQSQRDKNCMIPLMYGIQNGQIHRDKRQNGDCQGLGEEGNGKLLSNGYRVLVSQKEKSSGDQLYHNMNVLNITKLYALKMVKVVNFFMYILPQL